jgi:hypothetical protein
VECKLILEAHDALVYAIRREYLDDFVEIAQKEMERPLNFTACSLPRRYLKIPCDVEVGENYKDLKNYRKSNMKVVVEEPLVPRTVTEQFMVQE